MTSDVIQLARPKQWLKGVFVLVGPVYASAMGGAPDWRGVAGAFIAFAFASSACYVVNDLNDVEADRLHPRKRLRPIASGRVNPSRARVAAIVFAVLAVASLAAVGVFGRGGSAATEWVGAMVGLYGANVVAYSLLLKRLVVLDVISLASGFVLRVLGGCAAAGVEPSTWLLNCTLFLAMFLAFGKRLGERRTMGDDDRAAAVRAVQSAYTPDILRMFLVVTAVACLLTYAGYVQAQAAIYTPTPGPSGWGSAVGAGSSVRGWGMNLLWPTLLPAMLGLLRCIVLLESGRYDDPTELATRDRPFQLAGAAFVVLTVVAIAFGRTGT